ncbi:MAG: hypothetical protein R3B45_02065 [Bdellovibrionota bacterium]
MANNLKPNVAAIPTHMSVTDKSQNMIEWGSVSISNSGELEGKLVLSLDYFPENIPDKASLPLCYELLPSDFELGRLECELGGSSSAVLLAAHVMQECYTDPRSTKHLQTESIRLKGCSKAKVLGFNFKPQLRVDIESRPSK